MADDPVARSDLELVRGTVANEGEDVYWELVRAGRDDDRPAVVLTHGAGGTHAVWFQQIPALAARYRVVTWDSRGFGNSTNRNGTPTADAAASDLAAVLNTADVERPHLVGQSMGGWFISAFATAAPERVRSLTYADTVGGLWTDALREAIAAFTATGGLGEGGHGIGTHRALWPGTAETNPAHAFLYQALGSFHDPPMRSLGAVLEWTVAHDTIAGIGVPVMMIAGTHDQIFPAPALAASCALIPGARYVEIPASGHSPYFEQPAAWNDAMLQFLSTVESS
ncbi:MAG: alpha/beta hydrolase [Actinomycetota bacterium]